MKRFSELTPEDTRNFIEIYNYMHVETKLPKTADAIVAGGAGSRVDMAERAAELFHEGRAPVIVFSGFAHPAFGINESKLLAKRAIELGVPSDRILQEDRATNTGLNIQLSAQLLIKNGIVEHKIILVHRPFMTRRFLATAEVQWPDPKPEFYVTSARYNFEDYLSREDKDYGLAERTMLSMLKDYRAINDYYLKGFSSKQPKNPEAEAAFQRLVARGFMPLPQNETLATTKFTQ